MHSRRLDLRYSHWHSIERTGNLGHFFGADEYGDDGAFSRVLAASCEMDAMVSLLRTLTTVATNFQTQFNQVLGPSVSKLSKAFKSIPDEIIGVIFEHTVRMDRPGAATMAKSLSHVSRRFRNIALAQRSIWATLRSNGSEEEWDTFMERSGPASDFHVYIQTRPKRNHKRWDYFLDRCWKITSRWTTLTLSRVPNFPEDFDFLMETSKFGRSDYDHACYVDQERRHAIEIDMESVMEAFNAADHVQHRRRAVRKWQFPRLLELDIQSGDLDTVLSWTAPNLQVLRAGGLLTPSAIFSTVTALQFEVSPLSECNNLLTFVASLSNLSDLHLTLTLNGNGVGSCEGPEYFPLSLCSSVTYFRLLLQWDLCRTLTDEDNRYIAAFLHALRIPNLVRFSVSIDVEDRPINEDAELFGGLVDALLPVDDTRPLSRPSFIDFKIVEGSESENRQYARRPRILEPPCTLRIPLERIPAVSTLTLSTCTQVVFTHENDTGGGGGWGCTSPSLIREVCFSRCEQMTAEDLHLSIKSLKDVGAWDTVERITMENCRLVEFGLALEAVGAERLRYST